MSIRDLFARNLAVKSTALSEEVENIQELSNDTLNKYSKKAGEQIAAIKSKRGPKSAANKATIAKREAGRDKASNIKSERYGAAADKHSKESHAGFATAAHTALLGDGYKLEHKGKASHVYTKHDPETNTLFVAKHHIGSPSTRDSHHNHEGAIKLVSTNGTTSDISHSSFMHRNTEGSFHDHHLKNIKDELDRHHRWSKDSAFQRHMNEETDLTEEVLDEGKGEYYHEYDKDSGTHSVFHTDKGNGKAYGSFNSAEEAKSHAKKLNLKEDISEEVLDEARGRPRKDGTSNAGADREHIVMQIRKHISLRGANPIEFADGSKSKITDGEARLAQVIHSGLKSSIDKSNFEKKLDHSHDSFKSALKNKDAAAEAPVKADRLALRKFD